MENNRLWNVSTQQIQIFLKAVEFKNFTQVANYFNFTPSMISKTITAMEEELELNLFIRKPHNLAPTPTAIFLAREWRQTIASFNTSIEKAHYYEEEQGYRIALGFVDSSTTIDNLIMTAIREYTVKHPQINIVIEKHDMHRAVELLNNGLLDIVLTSEMEVAYLDEHHLPWEKVVTTNAAVYVPKTNQLFYKESLSFEDLSTETFLALNPIMHPTYHEWLFNICKKHGFIPEITAAYRTVRSLMFSLKLYDSIFIGETITSDWCDQDLKMYILPETSFTLIAWRGHDVTKEILDLKNFLKTMYPERI